jgi:outer membrane protein, heavy metal efflux system
MRTGRELRAEPGLEALPPGVSLGALTREDAVAVALWNSPSFELSLTQLGLARADLVEARLLRNPIFSLLFPWGPKQLEWTLQFPVDALWQRPRRVAAATLNVQAIAERLVYDGLTLVADVRLAFVEAVAGDRRFALAAENTDLVRRIAGITDARLRAGDISDLEARAARTDAAQVAAELRALEHERGVSTLALIARMGLQIPAAQVRLAPPALAPPAMCGMPEALVEDAVASRPDVRAAEIAIEAAGQRAAWERSRIVNLIAILDANVPSDAAVEIGPGINLDIPLLSRNQGAIARANVEIERASRAYLAVRTQVTSEVRTAAVRFTQAQQAMQIWGEEIVPSLQIEQRQAEAAYKGGEVALITLLDSSRRLVQARIRTLAAEIDLQRAAVALDRVVGRACASV